MTANQRYVRALQLLYTLWLPWKMHLVNGTMCFANNGYNHFFPAVPKLDMHKLWNLCRNLCDCHEQYVGQNMNKFST